MPEFRTKYFGNLNYQPESVIEFPQGLPGFDQERRFLLIEQEINKPIVFLQSLSRPELCFVTLPVRGILPGYELSPSPEDLQALDLDGPPPTAAGEDTLCLAVVSLAEDRPPTANLLSPIIVNWRKRLAVQAVQADSGYSHQHALESPSGGAPCS